MIYEPKGKAREYSPLAVNLYKGCGHGCAYCYVPNVIKVTRNEFDNQVEIKKDAIERLEASAKQFAGTDKQVLMSFTTDPYNILNDEMQLTREALKIFLKYKIPVAILSKGGEKVLKDYYIIKQFGKHIKVGASLTFAEPADSQKWERKAALPDERMRTLETLHNLGVRTWASMEPVIDPPQSISLILLTHTFVDEYQVGRVNHIKSEIDWKDFLYKAITILSDHNKEFYIKKDLKEADPELKLADKHTDQDYLNLPAFEDIEQDLFK